MESTNGTEIEKRIKLWHSTWVHTLIAFSQSRTREWDNKYERHDKAQKEVDNYTHRLTIR